MLKEAGAGDGDDCSTLWNFYFRQKIRKKERKINHFHVNVKHLL
jgi:hypothetical protein